jgi:hypothetical protein
MIINYLRNTCRSYGAENIYVILLHTCRSYGAYFQIINFIYPILCIKRKKQILWLKPFQNTHKTPS